MSYGAADENLMPTENGRADTDGGDAWLLQSSVEATMLLSVVLQAMAAGIIFIFSNTVMPALATLNPEAGIQTMNTINDVILNPLFAFVFFGGIASVYPVVAMWRNADAYSLPARCYALASVLIFFFGEMVVTGAANVPRNDALQAVDPDSEAGESYWRNTYLKSWVAWNTARGVFATISSVVGGMSLSLMGKRPA